MVTLFYDAYRILSRVYTDGAYLTQAMNDVPIEEINRPKTTKICYGVLDKDIELDFYINNLCDKKPKVAVRIMLKIAMYNIRFLAKKPYAVIDSTVELCKKMGKGGVSGFINAVLRKFIDYDFKLPENDTDRLSVKYSYPRFAVEKLVKTYGRTLAEEIMAYDLTKTFVRFNHDVDGEGYLIKNGLTYHKTPFDNLFDVDKIRMNEDFHNGVFTFQSIGSVAICSTFDGGQSLLDACAAPGGKSVYLADKFKTVTSCELHPHRVELIKAYAKRMGAENIVALNKDSSVFNAEFVEKFDAVLCDVPCSGYGTLKDNPDIKLKGEKDLESLSSIQYSILSNCSKYLTKGGTIVYSTCSVFAEENNFVVDKFLKENTDFSVCEISCPLNSLKTDHGLQFLPNISLGAGFYVSKLKKN